MSDRDLDAYREAYRYSLQNSGQVPPTDEELAALVTGELSTRDRDRVVLAMLKSPEAIEKHRILEELHQQRPDSGPVHGRRYRGLAVAAAIVLAVSVWTFLPTDVPVSQRTGDPVSSSPSGNVALRVPPGVYEWTAEPGARRYRITVYSNAGERLWQSDWVTQVRQSAPGGDELPLERGARYYWTVDIDGGVGRDSLGPYWFRLE